MANYLKSPAQNRAADGPKGGVLTLTQALARDPAYAARLRKAADGFKGVGETMKRIQAAVLELR